MNSKHKVEWTEIKIPGDPHIEEIAWEVYDLIWFTDADGNRYLSKDQGETWIRLGSLGWTWLRIRLKVLSWFGRDYIG